MSDQNLYQLHEVFVKNIMVNTKQANAPTIHYKIKQGHHKVLVLQINFSEENEAEVFVKHLFDNSFASLNQNKSPTKKNVNPIINGKVTTYAVFMQEDELIKYGNLFNISVSKNVLSGLVDVSQSKKEYDFDPLSYQKVQAKYGAHASNPHENFHASVNQNNNAISRSLNSDQIIQSEEKEKNALKLISEHRALVKSLSRNYNNGSFDNTDVNFLLNELSGKQRASRTLKRHSKLYPANGETKTIQKYDYLSEQVINHRVGVGKAVRENLPNHKHQYIKKTSLTLAPRDTRYMILWWRNVGFLWDKRKCDLKFEKYVFPSNAGTDSSTWLTGKPLTHYVDGTLLPYLSVPLSELEENNDKAIKNKSRIAHNEILGCPPLKDIDALWVSLDNKSEDLFRKINVLDFMYMAKKELGIEDIPILLFVNDYVANKSPEKVAQRIYQPQERIEDLIKALSDASSDAYKVMKANNYALLKNILTSSLPRVADKSVISNIKSACSKLGINTDEFLVAQNSVAELFEAAYQSGTLPNLYSEIVTLKNDASLFDEAIKTFCSSKATFTSTPLSNGYLLEYLINKKDFKTLFSLIRKVNPNPNNGQNVRVATNITHDKIAGLLKILFDPANKNELNILSEDRNFDWRCYLINDLFYSAHLTPKFSTAADYIAILDYQSIPVDIQRDVFMINFASKYHELTHAEVGDLLVKLYELGDRYLVSCALTILYRERQQGESDLHAAIRMKHMGLLQYQHKIIKTIDLSAKTTADKTVLHYFVEFGQIEWLDKFLAKVSDFEKVPLPASVSLKQDSTSNEPASLRVWPFADLFGPFSNATNTSNNTKEKELDFEALLDDALLKNHRSIVAWLSAHHILPNKALERAADAKNVAQIKSIITSLPSNTLSSFTLKGLSTALMVLYSKNAKSDFTLLLDGLPSMQSFVFANPQDNVLFKSMQDNKLDYFEMLLAKSFHNQVDVCLNKAILAQRQDIVTIIINNALFSLNKYCLFDAAKYLIQQGASALSCLKLIFALDQFELSHPEVEELLAQVLKHQNRDLIGLFLDHPDVIQYSLSFEERILHAGFEAKNMEFIKQIKIRKMRNSQTGPILQLEDETLTPLHLAVLDRDEDLLKKLASKADLGVACLTLKSQTPLDLASVSKQYRMIELMLSTGELTNQVMGKKFKQSANFITYLENKYEVPALRYAYTAKNFQLFKWLCFNGASQAIENTNGHNLLIETIARDDFHYTSALIILVADNTLTDVEKSEAVLQLIFKKRYLLADKMLAKIQVFHFDFQKNERGILHYLSHQALSDQSDELKLFTTLVQKEPRLVNEVNREGETVIAACLLHQNYTGISVILKYAAAFLTQKDLNLMLLSALRDSQFQIAREVLGIKFQVLNAVTGQSALHTAVIKQQTEICKMLCSPDHQASLLAEDQDGFTPVDLMVKLGQYDLIEALLPAITQELNAEAKFYLADALIQKKQFLLAEKVMNSLSAYVTLPLSKTKDFAGKTILDRAVIHDQPTLVSEVLGRIEGVPSGTDDQPSPFMFAATLSNWKLVELFLNHSEKLTNQDLNQVFVLACKAGHVNTIQKFVGLKDFVFNCQEKNSSGDTALHYLCALEKDKITALSSVICTLVARTTSVMVFNPLTGKLPISVALSNLSMSDDILSQFIKALNPVECNDTLVAGWLLSFCKAEKFDLAVELINKVKIFVNLKDETSSTALHYVVACDNPLKKAHCENLAALLCDQGADIYAQNTQEDSPLSIALKRGVKSNADACETVKTLVMHCQRPDKFKPTSLSREFVSKAGSAELLIEAINAEQDAYVTWLYQNGADPYAEIETKNNNNNNNARSAVEAAMNKLTNSYNIRWLNEILQREGYKAKTKDLWKIGESIASAGLHGSNYLAIIKGSVEARCTIALGFVSYSIKSINQILLVLNFIDELRSANLDFLFKKPASTISLFSKANNEMTETGKQIYKMAQLKVLDLIAGNVNAMSNLTELERLRVENFLALYNEPASTFSISKPATPNDIFKLFATKKDGKDGALEKLSQENDKVGKWMKSMGQS